MEINKKLKIGMRLPLLVFLSFAAFYCIQTRFLGRYINRITQIEAPRSEAASKMEVALIAMGYELLGYLQDHKTARLELVEECRKNYREYQTIYYRLASSDEDENISTLVDRETALLKTITEELININKHQVEKIERLNSSLDEAYNILNEAFRLHNAAHEQSGYKELAVITEMKSKLYEIKRDIDTYLNTRRKEYETRINENQNQLASLADTLNDMHVNGEHSECLEGFEQAYAQITVVIRELVALERSKISRLSHFSTVIQRLQIFLGENRRQSHADLAAAQRNSDKAIAKVVLFNPVIIVCGFLVILLSQGYAFYSVTQELPGHEVLEIQSSLGKLDTNIDIGAPRDSEQVADSDGKKD